MELEMNQNGNFSVEVDKIQRSEWETIIRQFQDSTIYQTWSYGKVRWGDENLSHLVLKDENKEVIAIAQAVIKKVPLLKAGIAYIPWGPLWKKVGKNNNYELFSNLLKSLKEQYAKKRGLLLRIDPHVIKCDENEHIIKILENEGFKINSKSNPYRTLLMDISPPLTDIRKKLNQKWRNQLNRSEKNNMTVHEGNSIELYDIFLKLQAEMLQRKNYIPGVDYEEFKQIQANLPEPDKMRIVVCEYEGEPLTATIASAVGDTGIYLLGASGDKGMQMKGAYLAQWLIIKWLQERGCKYYDLGGINPESNPGVYHFKSGMSGDDVNHIGQYEYCENKMSQLAIFAAEYGK
jgi:lipid II:glycine glycyltransferase (peptidoglycan interpeptide bridge formation enzyme)